MAHAGTTRPRSSARFARACALTSLLTGWLCGCAAEPTARPEGPLVINEVMTNNDAAWIDEAGQVDDWIEIANDSDHDVELASYQLRDERGRSYDFPNQRLAPGAFLVVFADGDPEQGVLHADWKLSAEGASVELIDKASARTIDRALVPALAVNDAYARLPNAHGAFSICRYATPEASNGASCGPAPTPQLADDTWPAFNWPATWLNSSGPLVLSELALKPARFIEVSNIGSAPIDVGQYALRIATSGPGQAWPTADAGRLVDWGGVTSLAAGARASLPIDADAVAELAADPAFEGVVTIFDAGGAAVDRVDFMHWPEGASLARADDHVQRLRFCARTSEGRPNEVCDPLASRPIGDRVRHLYTPGDYTALAEGDTSLALAGVKFIVDLQAGGVVHFLSTRDWALHYTFIRERIDGAAPLDRCDSLQALAFNQGWYEFSDREYFRSQGRRYLLGTLDSYAGSTLRTMDFALGDQIVAEQMQQAFFTVARNMDAEKVSDWSLHPAEPRQAQELAKLAGTVPIVGANAPFRNLSFQPLTAGAAYGVLKFFATSELEKAALGPEVIAVTDAVPNDIPFVGGLITEAFQTPLAHVNVLSQNRGTPNMALRAARLHPSVAPFFGKLVRFEVNNRGFTIRVANAEEADAFQRARMPGGPRVSPRLDASVRELVDLADHGLADLPSIGAKAAQLAELGHVMSSSASCPGSLPLPTSPFAIPMAYYLEHFERSGAKTMLVAAQVDAKFRGDPLQREAVLARMRTAIENTPLDPELLRTLESEIEARFGETRLRFRSSSNTEDLPGFNGAGLYESWSAALRDADRPIPSALRSVWASLWSARAYDEREFGNIDQGGVAMAVLVHPAFLSERANVIVISRDVLDPTRSDIHYMNAQEGEASVANPAPGVSTEQLIHHWRWIPDTPEVEYQSQSSLSHGRHVLSVTDAQHISCYIEAIHDHFQALLDPQYENRWFAMDVEIKLVGNARDVVIKQARPYAFGHSDRPSDCREF